MSRKFRNFVTRPEWIRINCGHCHGRGRSPGATSYVPCPICKGMGALTEASSKTGKIREIQ